MVSTLALVIGLVVGDVIVQPGAGFNIDPGHARSRRSPPAMPSAPQGDSVADHLLHIIPDTFFGAFAGGDLLQVLLIAILTGFACTRLGEFGEQGRRRAGRRS